VKSREIVRKSRIKPCHCRRHHVCSIRCLQKAHEHAEIVDFDLTILQDEVFAAVRGLVPDGTVLDEFQLNVDSSARRSE
jgi:hypothetical protein